MSLPIQRADDAASAFVEHVGVNHRRGDILVPQPLLNRPDIVARLQQVCRKGMAQHMGRHRLDDLCATRCRPDGALYGSLINMVSPLRPRARIAA